MIRIIESNENVIDLTNKLYDIGGSVIKRSAQSLYDKVKDCKNDGIVARGINPTYAYNKFDVIIEKRGNEFRFILAKDGITYVDFNLEDLIDMPSNSKEYLALTRLNKSKNPKPVTDDSLKNIEKSSNISKVKSTLKFDDIYGSWEVPDNLKAPAWEYFKDYLTRQDWENYKKWEIKYSTEQKEFNNPFAYGTDYYNYVTLYTGIKKYTYKDMNTSAYSWSTDW